MIMKSKYKYLLNIFSVILFILTLFSCAKEQEQPLQPTTPKPNVTVVSCDTIEAVSFSTHILPIFNRSCNGSGCHGGASPAKNLNLEASVAYTQLTTKGYIDTLKPEFSIIYAEMINSVSPMPPTGKLDTCKTNLVLKWITQKAKNN
jgi:PBP1b-binding outer membrane lipoprotein LpoB